MADHLLKQGHSGASYFFRGFELVKTPGLRKFVIVPLTINLVLFAAAFYYLFLKIDEFIQYVNGYIPEWLSWLNYLIWPLLVITTLVVFSYIFSTVANWIAAPFNGLLAEKVELMLSDKPFNTGGMMDMVKDLPRIFKREWQKFVYYLPKALGCLILFFVPVIGQTVAPVIWFLFTAWMMTIQYADYPFDNHKVPFHVMREKLAEQKGASLSFGSIVTLFTMIPLVNLVVMPVAVCGATAMWVEQYKESTLNR
ncbi:MULTISPECIES: sulfate transporter CysZ [Corallincola]|uniref:Sulfate transporter CysZ n=3 Tax=Corallincola TaxID=1775176 RepID=A0A368NKA5_9GAMM|nr:MULTISPECIES: sulfate transporter CysZ [Corallincola]RCU50303.1 sulfate transporter CysZ [Corallincola holothuriorum]TAA48685.1 sulfate transporter CysZ [Corallincola spongiicola]TCI05456.1 sulfate transporter CysZ [Corallincola luteus]